jgi:putative tricarboxylic transport membrane protein
MRLRIGGGDLLLSLVFAALGLVWVMGATELPRWDRETPGPGFLPLVFGVLLLGFAVLAALQAVFAPAEPGADQGSLRKPLLVLLISAFAVTALETAGFVLTMFAMLLALYALVERKPPVASLLAAALVTGALHVIFAVWLSVPLPLGPFGS